MLWWSNWCWKSEQTHLTKWGEFVKKEKKKRKQNEWSAIVPGYLVLFIFVYVSREMENNREMKPKWFQWRLWIMLRIILLSSLPRKCASGRRALYVPLVGKFWSLHNPQKRRMRQKSWFSERLFTLTQTW